VATGEARSPQGVGKLTEIDVEEIKGERSILATKIEQRYGVASDEANHQIDRWAEGREN
jgi:uncharacterized protein YjbJ (UPF0337 family)